jgi:hypothetical protein
MRCKSCNISTSRLVNDTAGAGEVTPATDDDDDDDDKDDGDRGNVEVELSPILIRVDERRVSVPVVGETGELAPAAAVFFDFGVRV